MKHPETLYELLFGGVFKWFPELKARLRSELKMEQVQRIVEVVDQFLENFDTAILLAERDLIEWSCCAPLLCLLETAVIRVGKREYPRTVANSWVQSNCLPALKYYFSRGYARDMHTLVTLSLHFSYPEMFEYLYFELKGVDEEILELKMHEQGLLFYDLEMLYPRELGRFVRVCLEHQFEHLPGLMSLNSFMAGLTPEIVELTPVMCGRFFRSTCDLIHDSCPRRANQAEITKMIKLMNPSHLLQLIEDLPRINFAWEILPVIFALRPREMEQFQLFFDETESIILTVSELVVHDFECEKYRWSRVRDYQLIGEVNELRKEKLGYLVRRGEE